MSLQTYATVQDWMLTIQRRAERQQAAARPRRPRPISSAPSAPSRRLFLLELECCGDVPTAAARSGCTPADVRAWRADPMFARDFAFAAAGYLRMLEQMLAEQAAGPNARRSAAARRVLASKATFAGADGRLDGIAWRDALRRCAADLGLEVHDWQPADPVAACA
jgi:hypothetical protein